MAGARDRLFTTDALTELPPEGRVRFDAADSMPGQLDAKPTQGQNI